MQSKAIAKKELELLRCGKNIIHAPKLKKADKKHNLWWEKQIDKLEKEHKIPEYKRKCCLQTIYTEKEIEGIARSGVEIIKVKSARPAKNESRDFIQLSTARKSKSATSRPAKYSNPYMEFMNKPEKEARCWYSKPERRLEELPLLEKAERLRTTIVNKFVEEFEAITKSEEINEYSVLSMYEMICPFPICSATLSKAGIRGAVPETTARYLGCYEKSEHNKLLHEIYNDTEASERPASKTAFGLNLPSELRREHFKENPSVKWAIQNSAHEDLETFAAVWKNITDLESTRKYCLYLLDNPKVIPPQFLLEQGMLIKNILKKPVYLGNLEKQLEDPDTAELLDITYVLRNVKKTLANINRRLTRLSTYSASSISVGEISDINIMV